MNYNLLSGGDLAFVGDAYYELYIREYLINKGITSLKRLHDYSVKYVSRTAQANIINKLMSSLTSEEIDIFKRGRNYNYKDKTSDYINASGFEALIGYLYLKKDNLRLDFFMNKIIEMVENNE